MKLKKVAPDSALKDRLTAKCQDELGKAWKPTYFMRAPGFYKCFCKDPSYRCYVSVMVAS